MNKLIGIIDSMDYKELKAIQKDLAEGNIGRLIKTKIDSIEHEHGVNTKVCPTCGSDTSEDKGFVLIFGPDDFRKKACFCAIDCLMYYLTDMKEKNYKRLEHK